jgi:hypothetical protein
MWNPLQKWDGEHALPSARFASPNFDEGMRNHRMGLFLPSVPDFVPENSDRAAHPFDLEAGKTLTLSASLFAGSGPIMTAMQEWYRQKNGLPKPGPWPRSFEDELALCRQGFLETVWDAPNEKWRHCIDWASSHAPGFATLLWLEAQATTNSAARRQSLDRVELAGKNMLRDGGPALFLSPANCHIMRWEFPFYYGYLPESLAALAPQIQKLIQSQQAEGGWSFQPANDQQKSLGEPGDSVLGLNAVQAASLLRYARITGDPAARAAGEKALEFMARFRVPRGGQTWECPMYEPDILPAGWAILAGLEGYRATGNTRWLHDAVYWAETGLPFVYHWTLDNRPMMLGATIPVFGSTFYTHSWLGMPVQWCGLVYAYHLFHLAQQLAQTPLPPSASMPPVTLGWSPQDWQQIVELISISASHQQFADGPRAGAYPDSITNFEQRNPAFINPEDILANLLALKGYDPEVKTVRLAGPRGDIVISSGAAIEHARLTPSGLEFQLRYFPGANSYILVSGLKPNQVQFADQTLSPSAEPVRRDPGWWWDAKRNWLFLVVPQEKETVTVTVAGS